MNLFRADCLKTGVRQLRPKRLYRIFYLGLYTSTFKPTLSNYQTPPPSRTAFYTGRDGIVTVSSALDNCDACCCSPDRDDVPYENASVCKATLSCQLASLLTAVACTLGLDPDCWLPRVSSVTCRCLHCSVGLDDSHCDVKSANIKSSSLQGIRR